MVPWGSLRSPKQSLSRGRDRVRAARAKEREMDSSEDAMAAKCFRPPGASGSDCHYGG